MENGDNGQSSCVQHIKKFHAYAMSSRNRVREETEKFINGGQLPENSEPKNHLNLFHCFAINRERRLVQRVESKPKNNPATATVPEFTNNDGPMANKECPPAHDDNEWNLARCEVFPAPEKLYEKIKTIAKINHEVKSIKYVMKKHKEGPIKNLGFYLYYTEGVFESIAKVISSVYKHIEEDNLTWAQAESTGNALGLMKVVINTKELRSQYLENSLVSCIFGLLFNKSKHGLQGVLHEEALGIMAILVRTPGLQYTNFVINSMFLPVIMHLIESDDVKKIHIGAASLMRCMMRSIGLNYVCQKPSRLLWVIQGLNNAVETLINDQDPHAVVAVTMCYQNLAISKKSRQFMPKFIHPAIMDATFNDAIIKGGSTIHFRPFMLQNLGVEV
ncbi:uncharacterized protein LOC109594713 isoform X2 [Aethina tumida]|uniref:uncharacterized protein LOC109594713 isoform X2 n=1 Tax=Aethina tumida TaxID=116153 RepID=UPI0021482D5A|nr:uncharacterized protein LOC109594713 isoform X2 [Aethina tumida]